MSIQIGQSPGRIFNSEGASISGSAAADDYSGVDFNLLGAAQEIMLYVSATVQQLAAQKFATIKANSKLARDAQEMANRVDRQISNAKDDKVGRPEADVIRFMRDNNINVDNLPIDTFLNRNLTKGDLQAIKAALDNFVSRQTDMGQQDNLEIQKLTTTFNFVIDAVKTLISRVGDLNQGIYNKL
ncbi:hypothetical protein [Burkholderia sp. WSM2232]|uniref:hypothetical protein n=1 Tax=Burkholderia sp. WSM2232 TaxID=944436 RepID=UPI0003FFC5D2|nr:hypothetical protein [Burkholderia sp. WSM2232]